MSERFSKLFALPEDLYCPGAPVMIAAGALQKDNETGRVLGQLKLRNIQEKGIKAVKVRVSPFDTAGKPLGGAVEHQYLDLSAARDADFGQKSAIKLADANTRSFTVAVAEVVFTNGSVWSGSGGTWEPLTPPDTLQETLEDAELVKQYQLKYGEDCKYQTRREHDLWFCACGAVNRESEGRCHRCGKDPSLLGKTDLEALKKERDQRLTEESKRAAEAKAAAVVQAKKMKKIALIAAPILLVVIIAGVFLSDYTKKNDAYNAAAALLEDRQFDEAMGAFAELENFKDSHEQAYQNAAYQKALYLIECAETDNKDGLKVSTQTEPRPKTEDGKDAPDTAAPAQSASADDGTRPSSAENTTALKCYRKALTVLKKLDGYKDSAQKIQEVNTAIDAAILEADYQDAIALLEDQEDHPAARVAFEALGNYKDSKTYFEGFRWLRVSFLENGKDAFSIFYNEKGERLPGENEVATVSEFSVDKRSEIVKEAGTGKVVSERTYDQYGNITKRKDTSDSCTSVYTYELDENGRPTKGTETSTYDSSGRTQFIADTVYEYNGKGQVAKRTVTQTYGFDLSKGKSPTSVTSYTYTYDDRGDVSSYTVDSTHYSYGLYNESVTTRHTAYEHSYVYDWVYAPGLKQ
ncbi:MAG: hypothetical protein K2N78_09935 [Oscillospiraceae bacterium]|nr:hypothetical protein [Oscillospiraceae bacterium]